MGNPFIILGGAGLPWVYPLALELGRLNPTIAINLMASFPFSGNTSRWSYDDPERLTQRETWAYPPGFASKFNLIFRPLIRARLNMLMKDLYRKTGERPYLIALYPWDYHYLSDVDSDHLIYLNYDDYYVNSDQKTEKEDTLERKLIERAGTILCSSISQTERFKKSFTERKSDIFHFPHGVHESFINPEPFNIKEARSVSIVGSLTSRYDWELINKVAKKMTDISLFFIGNIETETHPGQKPEWKQYLDESLALPNVKHLSGLQHRKTPPFYWQSAANWMPYMASLPFVRSCCPLKLPDGLASGHQVISADVPECRIYPEWVSIYRNSDEAVALITTALKNADTPEVRKRQYAQIEFARKNTWADRAKKLVEILDRNSAGAEDRQVSQATLQCMY